MNDTRDDPLARGDSDLRRLFDAARRSDASQAPAFGRLWATASGHRQRRFTPLRLTVAAGLLATAGLGLALLSWNGAPTPRPGVETVRIDWQAPTDFLLQIDGELLSTVPAIGMPPSLPGANPDDPPLRGDPLATAR